MENERVVKATEEPVNWRKRRGIYGGIGNYFSLPLS
jgi:hypothetical protein